MPMLELLSEFVPGNNLYLEAHNIDDSHHDRSTWLSKVSSVVERKSIEKILIDFTMNPEHFGQSRQIVSDLNKICPSFYICGDYNFWYNQSKWVKFFPAFLWLIGSRKVDHYFKDATTVYDTDINKTKMVMCLNRNLVWHRIYLLMLIAHKPWFHKITYSFLNKIGQQLEHTCMHDIFDEHQKKQIQDLDSLLPIKTPTEIDLPMTAIPMMWNQGAASINTADYQTHAFNIVTETSVTEGALLTEKTCKPFLAYQIPIIVGARHANRYLQDMGLDMFDDIVPWKNWDNELNYHRKIRRIADFLQDLLSPHDAEKTILDMHKKLHARLHANKQRFHSPEFLAKLTEKLQEIK